MSHQVVVSRSWLAEDLGLFANDALVRKHFKAGGLQAPTVECPDERGYVDDASARRC